MALEETSMTFTSALAIAVWCGDLFVCVQWFFWWHVRLVALLVAPHLLPVNGVALGAAHLVSGSRYCKAWEASSGGAPLHLL